MTITCTAIGELHVGDVGTEIRVALTDDGQPVENLDQLTEAVFVIQRPDGTTVELTAAVYGDPADSTLAAAVLAGTLTLPGSYWLQVRLDLGGWSGHSSRVRFRVHPVLT